MHLLDGYARYYDISAPLSKHAMLGAMARSDPKGRPALFPFWVLGIVAATIAGGVLLFLWPTTVARGWSLHVVLATLATSGLAVYVLGEPIRCRLRLSIKWLLAAVALVAVCCASIARPLMRAAEQRRSVAVIRSRGGFVRYDFDRGWGSGFQTKQVRTTREDSRDRALGKQKEPTPSEVGSASRIRPTGLEPVTYSSVGCRSIQLS